MRARYHNKKSEKCEKFLYFHEKILKSRVKDLIFFFVYIKMIYGKKPSRCFSRAQKQQKGVFAKDLTLKIGFNEGKNKEEKIIIWRK